MILVVNLSNSLIGLSMLTGNSGYMGVGGGIGGMMSHAERTARKAFTTPKTTPPWQDKKVDTTPVSSQILSIRKMKSIIDTKNDDKLAKLPDIQTSFTTYKALDRLRLLAEAAAKIGATDSERKALHAAFSKGVSDLKSFVTAAPSDLLNLSFGTPTRRAETIKLPVENKGSTVAGKGIVAARDTPLPGITGTEVLKIDLSKTSGNDSISVDLSQTPQPPTLDTIAAAINTAIAAIPMRDANGAIVTDDKGDLIPRWQSKISVAKTGEKWGLKFEIAGAEKLAIDQMGAKDALVAISGQTALDAPATAQIIRFDDPSGANIRKQIGTVAAVDRLATEQARLNPKPVPVVKLKPGEKAKPVEPIQAWAATTAKGVVTDKQGNSYIIGTTAGDLGINRSDGGNDLFLTKVNSEGQTIWQRTLGASGNAAVDGAAISMTPNGDIVVSGTVSGSFAGRTASDTDMLVAKFDSNGEEHFTSMIRSLGDDRATAIAVGADGAIYVGGQSSANGGDAFIARLSDKGVLKERRTIDSGGADSIVGLAIDKDGAVLALSKEGGSATVRKMDAGAINTELGMINLGNATASAISVSSTGDIAVAGTTSASLNGTQTNSTSGGRDGFVTRIDAGLSNNRTTYLGSAQEDQIDSVTFMGGAIYVGGRTTGSLDGAARRGAVDGFIGRIDDATGTIANVTQFGLAGQRTEPVRIAASTGGAGIMGALGIQRGTVNKVESTKLATQTALQIGDSFSITMDDGKPKKITIGDQETLLTLAEKIRKAAGPHAKVMTPAIKGMMTLQIDARSGHSITLTPGAAGKDVLDKLGITGTKFSASALPDPKAPKVVPGGNFGLGLTEALSIGNSRDAKFALGKIKSALSMTQSAYRSLYWDEAKSNRVNGLITGGGSPHQKAQLAQYQAALKRLSGGMI